MCLVVLTQVASVGAVPNGSVLLIDDEVFSVLAVVGTNLTTSRATHGTTAAPHAAGAAVHVLSGDGVRNFGVAGAAALTASMQVAPPRRRAATDAAQAGPRLLRAAIGGGPGCGAGPRDLQGTEGPLMKRLRCATAVRACKDEGRGNAPKPSPSRGQGRL